MLNARRLEIPLAAWPVFGEDEIQVCSEVLRSGKVNYWTGQQGREFETEFSEWVGTKRAIALMNGTVALELAHKGLNLRPGDEIITTPRTFVATASAFALWGIKPVFADIDLNSGNISPQTVEPLINKRTRAIVPVHLGGWPCDMEGFMALAEENKLHVIEDCAQAHGAKIKGKSVGSFGHVNAWSFCQDKIMSTGGEGGMVTTDDVEIWARMWSLKDHGKNYDTVYNRPHPPGFRWLHETWGTNWRLTDPQSAIGRIQLRKMASWTEARTRNAMILQERFQVLSAFRLPVLSTDYTHAWYRFYAYLRPEALKDGWDRARIIAECGERGFNLQVGSCSEIYLEKCFQMCQFAPAERLPNARELGETSLVFLTHPTLTEAIMHSVADVVEDVVKEATR